MHVHASPRALALTALAMVASGTLALSTPAIAAPSPTSVDVYADGSGAPSQGWTGGPIAGNDDPIGEPAPACLPGQCERENVNVHAASAFAATHYITLKVTVTWSDTGSNDDVAILDSSNNVVNVTYGSASPAVVSAQLKPGAYVVEIDGDIATPNETSYSATAAVTAQVIVPQQVRPTAPVSWARETATDPFRLGTEPSNVIGPKGTIYESPIFGFSTTQSFIQRSDDGGRTFNTVGIPGVGKPTVCTGGGDSSMATDPNDDLYFADLSGAPTVPASVSTDHGDTFTSNCLANDNNGVNVFTDRQWLSTDTVHGVEWYIYRDGLISAPGPLDTVNPHLYGEYIKSAPLAATAGSAGSGQLSFTSLCNDSVTTLAIACFSDVGTAGPAFTDNSASSPFQGTTYLPMNANNGVEVAVINPTLTFSDAVAASPHVAERMVSTTSQPVLFPTVTADHAGILYAAWVDSTTFQVLVSRSADQGKTWTAPVIVNGAPAAKTVMPWIVAGDRGRVDVVFYGSPKTDDPTTNYGPWNTYMAQNLSADTNLDAWTQTQVTDRPNHVDPVCLSGLGCTTDTGPGGDRELGDFFTVSLDKDGRAVVSFADGNNQLGNNVANGPLASPSFAMSVLQASGPSLYAGGGNVPAVPVPTNAVSLPEHANPIPFSGPTAPGTSDPALELRNSAVTYGTDGNLHVHLTVSNLDPATATSSPGLPVATYMTRWWYGGTWWYASAETNAAGQWSYFSGQAAPVSDGLAIKYAYYPATKSETGTVTSGQNGGIDITVPLADVGTPAVGATLYSVTGYALTHALPTAPTPPTASNFTDFPQIADVLPAYNTDLGAVVGGGNNGNGGSGTGNSNAGAVATPNTSAASAAAAGSGVAAVVLIGGAVLLRRRRGAQVRR